MLAVTRKRHGKEKAGAGRLRPFWPSFRLQLGGRSLIGLGLTVMAVMAVVTHCLQLGHLVR